MKILSFSQLPATLYRSSLDRFGILVLILILLLSNTSESLAMPADRTNAAPVSGAWSGTTSLGHPVSFTVNATGTQWGNLELITVYHFPLCTLTLTTTVSGYAPITNNQFSYTGVTFSFHGTFTSTATATGTFRFTAQPTRCGVFSQSGSWSAEAVAARRTITGNAGIDGATLDYGDGSVVADSSGNYSISVLAGWSGTVTPSKTNYTFTPPSRSYSNVQTNKTGQDYTATSTLRTITGNAGVGGVTLSYGTGAVGSDFNGNYSITVPAGWSGTVTPSKPGYTFIPPSKSYTNIQTDQTGQDYTATSSLRTITGNAGVGGALLSYGTGAVFADFNGNYSITVSAGWSGTVTPSKPGYTFIPPSKSYTNIQTDQTGQNYTAIPIASPSITGNAGVGGVTLSYGTGAVLADGNGNYSITVPAGWSGTVTPSKPGYTFIPSGRSYLNLQSSQAGQDYIAQPSGEPGQGADTTGVFRPSNGLLYLKNRNETGFADLALNYGIPGDYPVVADWDGNGTATIGVYRNGMFLLRNSNTVGFADMAFAFGQPGDQPIAGDWNGDGLDTIGVYRPSTGQFLLRNSNDPGPADTSFYLGNVGDVGIAGDWNGDGIDTTGVFRPSNGIIFLKNTNETGFADVALNYGVPGDKPVTGDWDNDGTDTIGVYRNGQFLLRNSNTIGFAEIVFGLGIPGDMPIAGDWDGVP